MTGTPDQDNLQGFNCGALGLGSGILACSLECTFDTSGCMDEPGCGDGVVSPGEQCDGDDLAGVQLRRPWVSEAGTLGACNSYLCVFDTSGCAP